MYGKLVPCGGGLPAPLLKTKVVVGRRPDCDVLVPCLSVSGQHCEMQLQEGSWWVRDLGSKNGTAVNGVRGDRLCVAPKNVLSVGRQRFVCLYQPGLVPVPTSVVSETDESLAFQFLSDDVEPVAKPVAQQPLVEQIAKPVAVAVAEPPPVAPRPKLRADLGKLIPCGGGVPIPLLGHELIVGRNPDCDVSLQLPAVSSRHCRLFWDQGHWFVQDLNSRNGTWIDGEHCQKRCVFPESLLALGKHRFTIQYEAVGPAPQEEIEPRFTRSLLEEAGLAHQFTGDRLAGRLLEQEQSDKRKKYDLND